jgi:hypothetical protein
MLTRSWMLVLLALIMGTSSAPRADEPMGAVSLILTKASATRDGKEVLFQCEARLDNATGKELTARSSFTGVLFDGLELVVTDTQGKVLHQQPYTFHQSPFALPGNSAALKKGSTKRALVFPIQGLADDVNVVKVRLVGTLPGSDYRRLLSSETLQVQITATARR